MSALAEAVPAVDGYTGPRVVGVDLSLTATGIASTAGWCLKHGQPGLTDAKVPVAGRASRLTELARELLEHIGTPDLVMIESPALSRARGGTFERGYVWWRVVRGLCEAGVPLAEVRANQLKQYATGSGNAVKGLVLVAVSRRWPQFETLGDDNMADAVVLAAMGADLLGAPLCPMPAKNREALEKLSRPAVAS